MSVCVCLFVCTLWPATILDLGGCIFFFEVSIGDQGKVIVGFLKKFMFIQAVFVYFPFSRFLRFGHKDHSERKFHKTENV